MARRQSLYDAVQHRGVCLLAHPQHAGDSLWQPRRVCQRREFHQPYAILVFRDDMAGELECKACLAGSADAGEREQAGVV